MSGKWLFTVVFFFPKCVTKLNCIVIIVFVECFNLCLGNTGSSGVDHCVTVGRVCSWLEEHWWWLPPEILCSLPTFIAINWVPAASNTLGRLFLRAKGGTLLPFLFICLQRMCPSGSRGQRRNTYTRVWVEGLDHTPLEVKLSRGELQDLIRGWNG